MKGKADGGLRPLYVLWEYPCRSEQFIARELRGLKHLEVAPDIVVLGPAAAADESEPRTGASVWRRPRWLDPRLWGKAALFAAFHPSAALRVLRMVKHLSDGQGPRSLERNLRMAVLACYFSYGERLTSASVIHAHFANLPASCAALLSSSSRIPWGFSVHARDFYAEDAVTDGKARSADYVLACSETLASDLRRRLTPDLACRVRTVRHGIDLEAWRPAAERTENTTPHLLIAAGRLQRKKGFHVLIEALARLRSNELRFQCQIVGAGPERAFLEERIRALSLHGAVELVPWLVADELRERVRHATALIVPSVIAPNGDRDNIPNVLVEGLALGVPIVASALPAIEEVIQHEGSGLLAAPGDADELARSIDRVCRDEGLRAGLRRDGRTTAERLFDARESAQALRDVLSETSRTGSQD